jgi:predicted Zn-dependent protease
MNTLAKLLVPISATALGVGVTFVVAAAPQDAPAAQQPAAPAAQPAPADAGAAAAPTEPAPQPQPQPPTSENAAPTAAPDPAQPNATEPASAPADGAAPLSAEPATEPSAPAPSAEPSATTAAATAPATAPAQPEDPALAAAQSIIARRFVEMAQQVVREARLDPAGLRQGTLLLRAATKLEPRDPRAWQLLLEAEQRVGNRDGVVHALKSYVNLVPGDLVAQMQLIELYASRIETGDAELAYLRGLAGKETVHPWVRSHLNVIIAQRLLNRGERKPALEAVDEAVKQNPVNVAALELKYQLLLSAEEGASAADRAKALLDIVQANPLRPAAMAEVGRLLASVGMAKDAGEWISRAAGLYARTPDASPQAYHDLVVDYAAGLYLGGQIQAARNVVEGLIKKDPSDPSAWFLQLVIDSADKDALAKSREGAAIAMAGNWARAAQFIANSGATSQPAAATTAPGAPQPGEVAAQVMASNDIEKEAAFVQAATDSAWFEIYFNDQPAAAQKWVDALAQVLPPDNVSLRRLRGWIALSEKKYEQAREALGPIRDYDPLAALGLLRVEAAAGPAPATEPAAAAASEPSALTEPAPITDPAAATEPAASQPVAMSPDDAARKLLEDYRSGLVGAIVAGALKDRNLKPAPHADAAAIREMLKHFPRGWLDLADNPQRYYAIRAEPFQVGYRFGDPMYVAVYLQNLTNLDIPIGDDGVIKPNLWFDVDMTSAGPRIPIPGAAFERIGMSTVLPAKGKPGLPPVIVRLDQGDLARRLEANPVSYMQLTGYVTTNIVPNPSGPVPVPGLGGYRVPFAKKITRRGFPIGKAGQLQQVFQELEQGFPDMKIRDLRLLAACLDRVGAVAKQAAKPPEPDADAAGQAAAPDAGDEPQQPNVAARMLQDMLDRMIKATEDETSGVAEWARFELARHTTPERARGFVEALMSDPRWEGRLLGVIAARALDHGAAMELTNKLAQTDPDEIVKAFATEQVDLLNRVPATTEPAAGAGGPAAAPDPSVAPAPDATPAPAPDPQVK